jgi:hypothetical protein
LLEEASAGYSQERKQTAQRVLVDYTALFLQACAETDSKHLVGLVNVQRLLSSKKLTAYLALQNQSKDGTPQPHTQTAAYVHIGVRAVRLMCFTLMQADIYQAPRSRVDRLKALAAERLKGHGQPKQQ